MAGLVALFIAPGRSLDASKFFAPVVADEFFEVSVMKSAHSSRPRMSVTPNKTVLADEGLDMSTAGNRVWSCEREDGALESLCNWGVLGRAERKDEPFLAARA